MRTLTRTLLALGFVGATAIGTSAPIMAQSITYYGPSNGVEIVTRPYEHRHSRYDRMYDNQRYAYQYYRGSDYRYRAHARCHPNGCDYRY